MLMERDYDNDIVRTSKIKPRENVTVWTRIRGCLMLARGPKARNNRILFLYSGRNEHSINPEELPIE